MTRKLSAFLLLCLLFFHLFLFFSPPLPPPPPPPYSSSSSLKRSRNYNNARMQKKDTANERAAKRKVTQLIRSMLRIAFLIIFIGSLVRSPIAVGSSNQISRFLQILDVWTTNRLCLLSSSLIYAFIFFWAVYEYSIATLLDSCEADNERKK